MTAVERIAHLEAHELEFSPDQEAANIASIWRMVGANCYTRMQQWDGHNVTEADIPSEVTQPTDYHMCKEVHPGLQTAERDEHFARRSLLLTMANSIVLLVRYGMRFSIDRVRFYRYPDPENRSRTMLSCRMTVRPPTKGDTE